VALDFADLPEMNGVPTLARPVPQHDRARQLAVGCRDASEKTEHAQRHEWVSRVNITVEVDDLEPGLTKSYYVAEYLRTVLKVRSLRRALDEALLEAERSKAKLREPQLVEANTLLERLEHPPAPSRLLRLPTKRPRSWRKKKD
jgi:hypothetical protein